MPETLPPLARTSGGVRSECAIPRPAVIQLTAPGSMRCTFPSVSRCRIAPSKRYVTVASPMCGCGRTSSPWPGANVTGPIWSRKVNQLTIRRCGAGRARRTTKPPPRSRSGAVRTSSGSMAQHLRQPAVLVERVVDLRRDPDQLPGELGKDHHRRLDSMLLQQLLLERMPPHAGVHRPLAPI